MKIRKLREHFPNLHPVDFVGGRLKLPHSCKLNERVGTWVELPTFHKLTGKLSYMENVCPEWGSNPQWYRSLNENLKP